MKCAVVSYGIREYRLPKKKISYQSHNNSAYIGPFGFFRNRINPTVSSCPTYARAITPEYLLSKTANLFIITLIVMQDLRQK